MVGMDATTALDLGVTIMMNVMRAKMEAMSREQRTQMGLAGREWLKEEADPAEWKKRFEQIVRQVVARGEQEPV